jgi:hypothetical protein
MNVANKVIYGLQTPKMFVNFSKSHLSHPKKGKTEYIFLRTEMSGFLKRNLISTSQFVTFCIDLLLI